MNLEQHRCYYSLNLSIDFSGLRPTAGWWKLTSQGLALYAIYTWCAVDDTLGSSLQPTMAPL
jgi:hypothetical protein